MSPLAVVCVLTFLHYVGAQMRGPVLPLYAAAHGATATGVGAIVAAHMMIAAVGSIPLGRASDVWGRRPLLLAGMIISAITSAVLPLAETTIPLSILYGAAGIGVAAFTPSALSLVGDAAASGAAGRAFAWYTIAHYGAIGVGSFLGGVVAQAAGYRAAFIASAGLVTLTFGLGLLWIERSPARVRSTDARATFADVKTNLIVWAGWIISFCGLVTQAVVYTFFPLLADQRGLTAAGIGVVFLVLGLANTAARIPAGWLVDRTQNSSLYAISGVLIGSIVTVLLPHVGGQIGLLTLVAVFGAVNGTAGVAIGVALTRATTPAVRGLVMGGYSTALYLGLALGSLALGPVIARHGYGTGFWVGGLTGAVGALVAAVLWMRAQPASDRSPQETP
jgi:MFS transporter, DHA1 family, multidrug resistance protein